MLLRWMLCLAAIYAEKMWRCGTQNQGQERAHLMSKEFLNETASLASKQPIHLLNKLQEFCFDYLVFDKMSGIISWIHYLFDNIFMISRDASMASRIQKENRGREEER